MDSAKQAYFLSKYRALDSQELLELANRRGSLAEEAADALSKVLLERGHAALPAVEELEDAPKELSAEERDHQTKLSSDLWRGPLSKFVQKLFAAQGLVFAFALLGGRGIQLGTLWIGALAALLMFAGHALGKKATRSICSNAEDSIEAKTKSLRALSYALWPAFLLSAGIGILLARIIRGA